MILISLHIVLLLYCFIFSKPARHFIFHNVWCICVVFKYLGFYPLKRIGNSELIPTSKCQFRSIYFLSCILAFAMIVIPFVLYFTEITFECWTKSIKLDVSQMTLFYIKMIIRIISIPYYFFFWSSLRKGLSNFQYDFNGVELMYPDHSIGLSIIAFDKIPTFNQCRSKIMIRMMCIIPGALILIGVGSQQIGLYIIHFHFLNDTTCSLAASDIKPFLIPIKVCVEIVTHMVFAICWYYFYVIYVDISHLFLSWSDSIMNEKYLHRSTFILHTKSFLTMLTNFNKIISPFNFMLVFSSLIISIFDGFFLIYGTMQFFKNPELVGYHYCRN